MNTTTIHREGTSRRLRLDTLVRVRWLAVLGQTAAVLTTYFGFGFQLPILACLAVIAASALLNIALRLRYGRNERLGHATAAAMLAYDILQLSALLYLTGGLQNPFALLFLAPVMISAVSLDPRMTILIGIFMVSCASALAFHHLALPWWPGETLELPILYRAGVWLAIVVGGAFIGVYAWRVADESRKLSDALSAMELILEREQYLTQLDGLAAAAAHELGTPLATINLIARELAVQTPKDSPITEDLDALGAEVLRCREILGKLTSLGDDSEPGGLYSRMSLAQLLEETAEPHRNFGVELFVDAAGEGPEPSVRRNPGLLYGLGNLVENAVDFAASRVTIIARWTADEIAVTIEDDGPGFPAHVLSRIGEPYVTTREDRRAKSDEGSGLGLGLFIAKTLLERSGARVVVGNRRKGARGASVALTWSRDALEAGNDLPFDSVKS